MSVAVAVLLIAAPFAPVLEDDEMYGETFSVVADLDDGTYVLAQMAVSNIGPGDGKGACRYILVPAGGRGETGGETYAREEWHHRAGALQIGPCKLEMKDGATRMEISVGARRIALALAAVPAPVRPPNRRAESSNGFYEMELLVPAAKASVQIQKGKTKTQKSGRGFMNHSRNTALPSKIARQWVRFRALGADRVHLALVRFPPGQRQGRGWSWRPGAAEPTAVSRAKLASKGGAFRVLLQTEAGTWRLSSKKRLFRDAPLEEYGVLGALLGRVLGNPVTHTFRGELVTPKGRFQGLLEISIVE